MSTEISEHATEERLVERIEYLEAISDRISQESRMLFADEDEALIEPLIEAMPYQFHEVDKTHLDFILDVKFDPNRSDVERSYAKFYLNSWAAGNMLLKAEAEHSPARKEEVLQKWAKFEANIDYDTFLLDLLKNGYSFENGALHLQSVSKRIRDFSDENIKAEYYEFDRAEERIEILRTQLPMKPESADNVPVENAQLPSVADSMDLLENAYETSNSFVRKYSTRDLATLLGLPARSFWNINYLTKTVRDINIETPLFRAAVANIVDTCMYNPSAIFGVADTTSTEIEAPHTEVPLTGFGTKEGESLLLSEVTVRAWLNNNIPSTFLRGVTDIAKVDEKSLENPEGFGDGWTTTGEYHPLTGEIKLAQMNSISNRLAEEVGHDVIALIIDRVEKYGRSTPLLDTLAHEIGHNVHFRILDYNDIVRWETVIQGDRTAVSNYVAKQRIVSSAAGDKDDFAESFKQFVTEPLALLNKSRDRFAFMHDLFARYNTIEFNTSDTEKLVNTWFGKAIVAAVTYKQALEEVAGSETDIQA